MKVHSGGTLCYPQARSMAQTDKNKWLSVSSGPGRCFICGETLPQLKFSQIWSNPHYASIHSKWYEYHNDWKKWFFRFVSASVLALALTVPFSFVTNYYYPFWDLARLVIVVASIELLLLIALYQAHQRKFVNFRSAWEREHGRIQ